MSDRTLDEVNAELDRLREEFLGAAERYVRERNREAFDAWRKACRRYQSVHREWWALTTPDVDYESVFGPEVELGEGEPS